MAEGQKGARGKFLRYELGLEEYFSASLFGELWSKYWSYTVREISVTLRGKPWRVAGRVIVYLN